MPLQNRVAPDGTIFADPARGLLMGNRGGQIHDAHRRLTARRWASRQWIACSLSYKGRREAVWVPNHHTQLFFLDEATALAAGHRPCALCRRADFLRFMAAWQRLRGLDERPKVAAVDSVLQAERVCADKRKITFEARLGDLPDGVMVLNPDLGSTPHPVPLPTGEGTVQPNPSPLGRGVRDSAGEGSSRSWLLLNGRLLPWSPSGYGAPADADPSQSVRVLTPRFIVAVIADGYQPMLHPSARTMSASRSA